MAESIQSPLELNESIVSDGGRHTLPAIDSRIVKAIKEDDTTKTLAVAIGQQVAADTERDYILRAVSDPTLRIKVIEQFLPEKIPALTRIAARLAFRNSPHSLALKTDRAIGQNPTPGERLASHKEIYDNYGGDFEAWKRGLVEGALGQHDKHLHPFIREEFEGVESFLHFTSPIASVPAEVSMGEDSLADTRVHRRVSPAEALQWNMRRAERRAGKQEAIRVYREAFPHPDIVHRIVGKLKAAGIAPLRQYSLSPQSS